jgi:hypothetical protein
MKGIATALAKAQAEMGKALKQSNNSHFKSKYADLGNVMDACLPALNAAGIAVIQPTGEDEHGRYVETVLIHGESGESLTCRVPLIVSKNDMQGYGSAVTYGRRYGLMAMAGIAAEDDDDNAAAKAAPKLEQKPAPMAEADFFAIKDLIEQTETDEGKFCAYWKVSALHDLNATQAQNAIAMLKKKAEAANGSAQQ